MLPGIKGPLALRTSLKRNGRSGVAGTRVGPSAMLLRPCGSFSINAVPHAGAELIKHSLPHSKERERPPGEQLVFHSTSSLPSPPPAQAPGFSAGCPSISVKKPGGNAETRGILSGALPPGKWPLHPESICVQRRSLLSFWEWMSQPLCFLVHTTGIQVAYLVRIVNFK